MTTDVSDWGQVRCGRSVFSGGSLVVCLTKWLTIDGPRRRPEKFEKLPEKYGTFRETAKRWRKAWDAPISNAYTARLRRIPQDKWTFRKAVKNCTRNEHYREWCHWAGLYQKLYRPKQQQGSGFALGKRGGRGTSPPTRFPKGKRLCSQGRFWRVPAFEV